MHDSQSWSHSSPSTAGSTLGKRLPSLAVVKMPSVGRWVEEPVGVRKAAPLRMKPERAEVILRDLPIRIGKLGNVGLIKHERIQD